MPIKVFKMNESNYVDKDEINNWANKNNFKITNINVCPASWHISKYSKVEDMELIITVIYHKKRKRKNEALDK